jgi:hypothetical protein
MRHGLTAETVIPNLEDGEDYKTFEATVIADYCASIRGFSFESAVRVGTAAEPSPHRGVGPIPGAAAWGGPATGGPRRITSHFRGRRLLCDSLFRSRAPSSRVGHTGFLLPVGPDVYPSPASTAITTKTFIFRHLLNGHLQAAFKHSPFVEFGPRQFLGVAGFRGNYG